MIIQLPFDTFIQIPVAGGTIQNINEQATIEIATAQNVESGLVLYPHEKFKWSSGVIYARSRWENGEAARVAVL